MLTAGSCEQWQKLLQSYFIFWLNWILNCFKECHWEETRVLCEGDKKVDGWHFNSCLRQLSCLSFLVWMVCLHVALERFDSLNDLPELLYLAELHQSETQWGQSPGVWSCWCPCVYLQLSPVNELHWLQDWTPSSRNVSLGTFPMIFCLQFC